MTARRGAAGSGSRLSPEARQTLLRALAEDRFRRDRTTRGLFDRPTPAKAEAIAQADAVLSGMDAAIFLARRAGLRARPRARDGEKVRAGRVVLELRGDARHLLAAERTILNALMHLSGVATRTAEAVAAARAHGGGPRVYATRKTLPGLRDLEKQAVVDGGGEPHRRDLASAILVKNNHLAFLPIPEAVARLRRRYGRRWPIQVEVRSLADARAALAAGADALLLDNTSPRRARSVVRRIRAEFRRPRPWIELSGGLAPETLPRYASAGADAASLGAITHSAPAVPFRLAVRPLRRARGAAPAAPSR